MSEDSNNSDSIELPVGTDFTELQTINPVELVTSDNQVFQFGTTYNSDQTFLNTEQLFNDVLSMQNGDLPVNGLDPNQPYLEITEQPQSRGYRFRYQCEGKSHGCLQGVHSNKVKKTYPTVQICNYQGPAKVVVSLVTDETIPKTHAHELLGKGCNNGLCVQEIKSSKTMEISFPNLSIMHVTKKKVKDILSQRILESLKLQRILTTPGTHTISGDYPFNNEEIEKAKKQAEEDARHMVLNRVRLCFQTYILGNNNAFVLLPSVVSEPIFDCKSPGAAGLKICRMDKQAGCCSGGDEVFLLCDKVQKDDIAVRFFETNTDGDVTWEEFGSFGPADVHRQYAIVFKTPPYWNAHIDRTVNVNIQLQRRSDQEYSEEKQFMYFPRPIDKEEVGKKRKKAIFGHYGSGGGGGGWSGGGFGPSSGGSDGSDGFPGAGGGGSSNGDISDPTFGGGFNYTLGNQLNKEPEGGNYRLSSKVHENKLDRKKDSHQRKSDKKDDNDDNNDCKDKTSKSENNSLDSNVEEDCAPDVHDPDFQPHLIDVHPNIGISAGQSKTVTTSLRVSQDTDYKKMVTVELEKADIEENVDTERLHGHGKVYPGAVANNIAWQISERTANAMQRYAITGNIIWLLHVQRYLVAVQNEDTDTALHCAVIHQQIEVVRNLVEVLSHMPDTAIINQYNQLRQTALHLAVITRQPLMVELLIKGGADTTLTDNHSNNPAHLAAEHGYDHCLEMLVRYGHHGASPHKPFPELDCFNQDGLSSLHVAVINGHLNCVKILINACANVNLPDGKSGHTPLHHAVDNENLAITGHLLLEAGANVNEPNYAGNTALHLAAGRKLLGVSALLMAAGADPEAENFETVDEESEDEEKDRDETEYTESDWIGNTPFDFAAGDVKMGKILRGEPYMSVSPLRDSSLGGNDSMTTSLTHSFRGLSIVQGDIHNLDPVVCFQLSDILDPVQHGQDWRALAAHLGFGNMADMFQHQPSPTRALLDNYEACEGTIAEMVKALKLLNRQDALQVIQDGIKMSENKSAVTQSIHSHTRLPGQATQETKNTTDCIDSGTGPGSKIQTMESQHLISEDIYTATAMSTSHTVPLSPSKTGGKSERYESGIGNSIQSSTQSDVESIRHQIHSLNNQ